ncbi:MAG: cytochrome D1 domain-containing protein [Thiohalophilus sp.]|uniref:cytochrome D1 domain-containing protein n=1 Tax=Thiohalophilus sp. TaxID=3028392 RepID=UPI0028706336|nr:cytochrome D1 domain-containing protein [Thiohalophilus sp.]MDR9437135.1 cytochrome D1 domain-containing protein [Thiohalophilus sp.]
MSRMIMYYRSALLLLAFLLVTGCQGLAPRATGDLGLVIERATGSVQIIDTSSRSALARIEGLGDLSHASVVYSRDERYAYVFGRDGGLTKIDMLLQRIDRRIIQSGNSIGGAISQDGSLIAVSNYEPGGVKIFDAQTLELVADIPAIGENGKRSKVVGLVDAPQKQFVFSLYEADEIWVADMRQPTQPQITRYRDVGKQPYDALISGEGRYYIAGLFGEDGLALLDLWQPQAGVKQILGDYGRGEEKLPVYKMPHLEGWAMAGDYALVPAVGGHEVLVIDRSNWQLVKRIPVHSQPVFVMASPDQRHVWVNFAHPDNDTIQVIDVASLEVIDTLKPGPAVLHMEFTPRGHEVWVSVRDANRVRVYDAYTRQEITSLEMASPSGIFFTNRAHRIGL